MFRSVYQLYRELLTPITMITTSIGAVSAVGSVNGMNNNKTQQHQPKVFSPYINFLGRTSIGFCVGLVYPISLPICATYVMFGNKEK